MRAAVLLVLGLAAAGATAFTPQATLNFGTDSLTFAIFGGEGF